ncbi:MAG: peptide deformylase [Actinomycetia bacterium]|nr:peptide deformylase [Actinomycetes bacterium]
MSELPTGGTARPITRWGTPVMHRELRDVAEFDGDLATLVADMFATMYAADGAGLAANQVGVDLKVFVFDCTDDDDNRVKGVVCNPVLTLPDAGDRRLDDDDEGCLSLPGGYATCARPDRSQVDGFDHTGASVTYIGEGGTLARCLPHETDHLYGRVFGDRLSARARKKLFKQAEAIAHQFDDDWPASRRDAATAEN